MNRILDMVPDLVDRFMPGSTSSDSDEHEQEVNEAIHNAAEAEEETF